MFELPGMDALCAGLVSPSYARQGLQELCARSKLVKDLFSQRKMPAAGWDEMDIERLFADLALMDSSNFKRAAGVGEREARVACPLVARRNLRLAHGIGRSGDIAAEQPKAAGSTLMARMCHFLVRDALRLAGLPETGPVQVLPLATGMTITVTLLSCQAQRVKTSPGCRYVIWSRIDQKTCLKAIASANLIPVVIEPVLCGDELQTDLPALEAKLEELGPENVTCIVTTTSCFAPRACDDVEGVARLCAAQDLPHIINNAYGVQSAQICARVTRACRVGRVDAIIQSTDKNFMVPVGGAILTAPLQRPQLVEAVSSGYPGRASASAHVDLGITLLHWGRSGWLKVLGERESLFAYLQDRVQEAAAQHGERMLVTPGNPISVGITLSSLTASKSTLPAPALAQEAPQEGPLPSARADGGPRTSEPADRTPCNESTGPAAAGTTSDQGAKSADTGATVPAPARSVTFLGSMLWQRSVSGVRVVARGKLQKVAGIEFSGYGSSCSAYPHDYCTAAAAIGTTKEDVDLFVERLKTCFTEFKKKM